MPFSNCDNTLYGPNYKMQLSFVDRIVLEIMYLMLSFDICPSIQEFKEYSYEKYWKCQSQDEDLIIMLQLYRKLAYGLEAENKIQCKHWRWLVPWE